MIQPPSGTRSSAAGQFLHRAEAADMAATTQQYCDARFVPLAGPPKQQLP
jgi:hypothetical protein